jgi:hypothetical protein
MVLVVGRGARGAVSVCAVARPARTCLCAGGDTGHQAAVARDPEA